MAITSINVPTTRTTGTVVAKLAAGAAPTNGNSAAPADAYSPNATHGNENIISPKQALAMKAQSAKPGYSTLVEQMASASPTKKRELLAKFHKTNPNEYNALVQDIRIGKVSDGNLKLAVGLETLNGTKWAKTREGARVAAHLNKLYDQGKIATAKDPGGLGRSDITDKGTGRDGSKADTKVTIKEEVLGSPEAAATVLAHEGQHSYRASVGEMKRSLEEEVDAHTTQNAVWGEFGKEKYSPTAVGATTSLALTALKDSREKLYNYLAPAYVQDYTEKGGSKNQAAARGMINDYVDVAGRDMGKTYKELSDEGLESLLKNANSLLKNDSSETYKSAVESLKFEYASRQPVY